MASDSGLFRTRADMETAGHRLAGNVYSGPDSEYLPLVEAKMVHHFDHRFGTYEGQTKAQENQGKLPELDDAAHADPIRVTLPYYWVSGTEVAGRLDSKWARGWLLGWRDITGTEKQRTVIAAVVPRAATGDTLLLALPSVEPSKVACLYACLCSFALDYSARQKVGGTHLKYHVFKQLPVLAPGRFGEHLAWRPDTTASKWLLPRILELSYTAWDIESFARDVGYDGPPFRWDTVRRQRLRAELDAAFFHLYGLSRDDTDYVMDTQRAEVKAQWSLSRSVLSSRVLTSRRRTGGMLAYRRPELYSKDPPCNVVVVAGHGAKRRFDYPSSSFENARFKTDAEPYCGFVKNMYT